MAVVAIRNIDETIMARLRLRAATRGRSMEDEARDTLRAALSTEMPRPRNLAQAIHDAQIAAIPRSRGAGLATRNMRDFSDCGDYDCESVGS